MIWATARQGLTSDFSLLTQNAFKYYNALDTWGRKKSWERRSNCPTTTEAPYTPSRPGEGSGVTRSWSRKPSICISKKRRSRRGVLKLYYRCGEHGIKKMPESSKETLERSEEIGKSSDHRRYGCHHRLLPEYLPGGRCIHRADFLG